MSLPAPSTPPTTASDRPVADRPWPRGGRGGASGYAGSADELVSGEAVALELPHAGLGPRILAGLLDLAVIGVGTSVLYTVFAVATVATDPALLAAATLLATIIGLVGVPTAVATLTRGSSVGKVALGLRTVRDDGGPISFQHALTRSLIAVVEVFVFLGVPAVVVAAVHPRGKRLGDVAAGTYVVSERVRLALPLPPPMPPPLVAWAAEADVARPPAHLTLAVRQFLARAHTMEPRARHVLALRLADLLSEHVSPLPPPGTPPEPFCCAVLAARRERDLVRLHREEQTRLRLLRRSA